MMSASASASARNRSPFTPTQWQELEQQALVFKYMVTGTPIPPDLIYSIKRSLDSSISSRLFPHHPSKSFCSFPIVLRPWITLFFYKNTLVVIIICLLFMRDK